MENVNMKPRFCHDCDSCIFLGQYGKYDLYVCPNGGRGGREAFRAKGSFNGMVPGATRAAFLGSIDAIAEARRRRETFIARYGEDGDYQSGAHFVGKIDSITEAHRRYKLRSQK